MSFSEPTQISQSSHPSNRARQPCDMTRHPCDMIRHPCESRDLDAKPEFTPGLIWCWHDRVRKIRLYTSSLRGGRRPTWQSIRKAFRRSSVMAALCCSIALCLTACQKNSLYCDTSCTDTDIKTNVQVKIAADRCLYFQNIRVTCYQRMVTLDGSVENPVQKQSASKLARSVPGVKKVRNRLRIKDQYNRPV